MIASQGQVWHAELTVGTMQGYEGPEVVRPQDIIVFIEEYQKDLNLAKEQWFPTIVWTRGTVLGPTFASETVIKISAETNPIYSPDANQSDMITYATNLAAFLGKVLKQVRVYVSVYPVWSMIVEQS